MKVLIVSHNSFSKTSNNGKTLESIFSSFEKKELSQIFFSENENPDIDYCDRYYKITDLDVLKLTIKNRQGKVNYSESKIHHERNRKWIFNFFKKTFKNFSLIRDLLWAIGGWRKSDILDWAEKENPDVVFFLGGNYLFSHRIAREISVFINKPLVLYLTDDYIIYPKKNGVHDFLLNYFLKKSYESTLKVSCLNYVVGKLMSEEYENEFKRKFKFIMNSIPYSDMHNVDFLKKIKTLKVAYFGGLHLNRWRMLARLSKACENIEIYVYSMSIMSMDIKSAFDTAGIKFMGGVNPELLDFTMKKYDALLHVESDDTKNRGLTRLSVSTKIPEYVITGIPVLGFGPREVASMRILEDEKIGTVVDSSLSDEKVNEKITDFINGYKNLSSMAISAHSFAVKNFMSNDVSFRVRLDFEEIIQERGN